MADYKVVDAEALDSALNSLADSIRNKSGVTGDLAFPKPNGFKEAVDSIQMKYFATGIISNVKAGQALNVTGIKDDKTGEIFDVKGVFACIEPTETANYTGGYGTPSLVVFYNANTDSGTVIVAVHNILYTVRAGCNSGRLTMSGNSFSFIADTSMYGVMPASKWRWVAWG